MFTILVLVLAAQPVEAGIKLDPLMEKLVAPNPKDSELLKIQKERALERAIYFEKSKMVIDAGRWNANFFGDYIKEVRLLWENLAELTTRPEDKVKCYEMRLEAAKEFEKFIRSRVEVGSDPSQYLNVAKAARLDAEVDLIKLKEAVIKPAK